MYRIKLNRRIRIRMYGGVRGRELITPSYSIFFMAQLWHTLKFCLHKLITAVMFNLCIITGL